MDYLNDIEQAWKLVTNIEKSDKNNLSNTDVLAAIKALRIVFEEAEKIEITNNTAKQIATLQEGIDRDLAKNISALIKKSKLKVQSSIQGDSIRVAGKKRDDLQEAIQFIKEQKYSIPLQFDNFRD